MSEARPARRRLNLVAGHGSAPEAAADDRGWTSQALCNNADPDELFLPGKAQHTAKVICRHCPVIQQCGAEALDNQVEHGIWGGMTERQRRALLKQHPQVVSWADFFKQRNRRSAG